MFAFFLIVTSLFRAALYIAGPPLTFVFLGLPWFYALWQRYRIKQVARDAGWKVLSPERKGDSIILKREINGYKVEVWPHDAFGAKVFVYFKERHKLDLEWQNSDSRRAKKLVPLDTANKNFNMMFRGRRAGKVEAAKLSSHPNALEYLVSFRARWMLSAAELNVTGSYLLMQMCYGTALAYYLPPRALNKLTEDAVSTTAAFEAALAQ